MLNEVTKKEFKDTYFKYGNADDGWGKEYWDKFYENSKKQNIKYFVDLPANKQQNRMMIVDADNECHLFFLAVDQEEAFFDFPSK